MILAAAAGVDILDAAGSDRQRLARKVMRADRRKGVAEVKRARRAGRETRNDLAHA